MDKKLSANRIEIDLSELLFNRINDEINDIMRLDTTIPITRIDAQSIKIYNRTIYLNIGITNPIFEKLMILSLEQEILE